VTTLTVYGLADILNEAWRDQAFCREIDPELMYPVTAAGYRQARKICAGCPVIDDCREHALDHWEQWGVWGGMSEEERRQVFRLRRQLTAAGIPQSAPAEVAA
jgi:WhiB family redox-sensing transcriptional regulator